MRRSDPSMTLRTLISGDGGSVAHIRTIKLSLTGGTIGLEPLQVEFLWPTRALVEILDYHGFTFLIRPLEFGGVQSSLVERRDATDGFEIRV